MNAITRSSRSDSFYSQIDVTIKKKGKMPALGGRLLENAVNTALLGSSNEQLLMSKMQMKSNLAEHIIKKSYQFKFTNSRINKFTSYIFCFLITHF
jgi:hypothetical protein